MPTLEDGLFAGTVLPGNCYQVKGLLSKGYNTAGSCLSAVPVWKQEQEIIKASDVALV